MKYHGGMDRPPQVMHDYYRDTRHVYGTRAYFAEEQPKVNKWDILACVVILALVIVSTVTWLGYQA